MKKIAAISLVVLMLVVSVVPAFAKGGTPGGNGPANGAAPAGTCPNYGSAPASNRYSYGVGLQTGYGVRSPYALSGTITALDSDAGTVTALVACGNPLVKPYIGQEITLQTTQATRFLLRNEDGTATPISFADLLVGQNISSHGTLANDTWAATRITVGALLECLP
jgi:hypothetical protein